MLVSTHYRDEAEWYHKLAYIASGRLLTQGTGVTRERERGTMGNLLATPALPVEVMTGKLVPYILIGLVQATIIMLTARYLFRVPFLGSVPLLYGVILIFIAILRSASPSHPSPRTSFRRCK